MIGLGSDKNTEGKIFNSTMHRKIFTSDFNEAFLVLVARLSSLFTVHLSFFLLQNVCGRDDKPDLLGGGGSQLHYAGGLWGLNVIRYYRILKSWYDTIFYQNIFRYLYDTILYQTSFRSSPSETLSTWPPTWWWAQVRGYNLKLGLVSRQSYFLELVLCGGKAGSVEWINEKWISCFSQLWVTIVALKYFIRDHSL